MEVGIYNVGAEAGLPHLLGNFLVRDLRTFLDTC